MNITKEELAAQYEKLSDQELLRRVESGTMTSLGFETACEELHARGVKFKSPQDDVDVNAAPEEENSTDFGFVTLAHLVNPLRANLLRANLQSEGIVVHVLGEHLGVMHMMMSAGTGGIRVQVRSDQLEHAREILAEFDRIEQTVDDIGDEQLHSPDGGEDSDYSTERASPYSPPKSRVADVEKVKARRESFNKPSTPLFFWLFTLIAIGTAFYVAAISIGN